ncbi:MAG TPA: hypothetical protein DCG39_12935, partial [Opitutae bacterium]|nr:hypothetical protein [Opitutae bacterium]
MVSEEGAVSAVGFGGHGYIPILIVVVVRKVIEGELRGDPGEVLTEHSIECEIGRIGRVSKDQIDRGSKILHRLPCHGEGKKLAVEALFPVQGPGIDHPAGIFPWKIFRAEGPKRIGRQHAVLRTHEKVPVAIGLPPLVEGQADVLGVEPHQFVPVGPVFFMPQQVGHSNQGLGNLEPVHGETTDLLPENLAEVPFVALAKETEVSRVLVDLPGTQDVLDQFPTVGSGVPGGALVVGEHDG